MEDWKKESLEHIFNLALDYYSEQSENNALKIPDNQPEKQFIQEVFNICGHVLGKFEN